MLAGLEPVEAVVGGGAPHGLVGHHLAYFWGVDHHSSAGVDADVSFTAVEVDDEVAGLCLVGGDWGGGLCFEADQVLECQPEVGEYVHDEAGAVETGWGCPVDHVGGVVDELHGVGDGEPPVLCRVAGE